MMKISKSEIKTYLTERYINFRSEVIRDLKKAAENRHRLLVILSGDDNKKLGVLTADLVLTIIKRMTRKLSGKSIHVLYVFHDEFDDAKIRVGVFRAIAKGYVKKKNLNVEIETAVYEQTTRILGTTVQLLVMDLINSVKPNDIGRIVGTVEGGGLVILLTPPWSDWHNRKNLFQQMLTVPQHPEPRKVFIRWLKDVTLQCNGVYIYDVDNDVVIAMNRYAAPRRKAEPSRAIAIPSDTLFPLELYKLALTQDQVNAVQTIERIFDKSKRDRKRRNTVVLISDRGRGKSCAIGIALAGIIYLLRNTKNKVRIAVTAPELVNIQSLMMMAEKALKAIGIEFKRITKGDDVIELKGDKFSIEYWPPVVVPNLDVDVIVVDEAAGIPVPLLHKIWRSCKYTIFATTIHGYEGAGRGFSVRFLKRLKESADTNLQIYELEEPIRYGIDDPVEKWSFRVLLLDAEPDELSEEDLEYIRRGEFVYLRVAPEELFTLEREQLLRSAFGILVLAHYRNEPDDLAMMADAPHHTIRILQLPNGKTVAVAQLAEEGPIPDDYIDVLLRGGKIPGNIIPDRLLKHLRIREVGKGVGWRIVRIAVHPDVQGRGIGSYMLKKIVEEAIERNYDWVGSGFGVTEELLNFWVKNGFIPVHISPDRNPVSGEYTILVIKPLKPEWSRYVKIMNKEFREKILHSLHDTYRDLETEVALMLLKAHSEEVSAQCEAQQFLTPIQLDRALSYIAGHLTYESCSDVIRLIAENYFSNPNCWPSLGKAEELLLVAKALQGLSWDDSARIANMKKQKAIDAMRSIIAKLLVHHLGIAEPCIDKVLGVVDEKLYNDATLYIESLRDICVKSLSTK